LAPIIASALLPEGLGALGTALATGGIGAALGAGSGAGFSALTGGDPGKGALTGGISGGLGGVGGPIGEAVGIGSTAGSAIAGGVGGLAGAEITGTNPILGAAEGAAPALISGVTGFGASPTTSVTPTSPATGAGSAAGAGGSVGAQSAAVSAPVPLDPTAGSGTSGISGGGKVGDFLLPGTDTPIAGGFSGGTIDASGGGLNALLQKFTDNPMLLAAAAPMAMQMFGGGQPAYPAERQLQTLGTNLGSQGQALAGYINSGTLPAGAKQAVDASTNAQKATTRSTYGRLGLSGSTMEAQALGEIDSRAAGQTFLMGDQLLQQGLSAEQIAAGDYRSVLQSEQQRDTNFNNALSNFSLALAGGGVRAANQQPTSNIYIGQQ
jgi:hypothetical protein